MKFLFKVVKRICLGIFSIYSTNVLFNLVNIVVPINLYTIAMSSMFGLFGVASIIFIQLII